MEEGREMILSSRSDHVSYLGVIQTAISCRPQLLGRPFSILFLTPFPELRNRLAARDLAACSNILEGNLGSFFLSRLHLKCSSAMCAGHQRWLG